MSVSFPDLPSPSTSVVELLRTRASLHGSKAVFSFLENGETETEQLDYASLDADARRIAVRLQERGMEVLFEPGQASVPTASVDASTLLGFPQVPGTALQRRCDV